MLQFKLLRFELVSVVARVPVMAENCLLPGFYVDLLTRKLPLKIDESVAMRDTNQSLGSR